MTARQDGLSAEAFPVAGSESAEAGERVRAGQYRREAEGSYQVVVLARVGPLWLVTRPHGELGVMSESELSAMSTNGESDGLLRAYAEAGCLR